MVYRRRFAKRLQKLADGAHGPVLQISKSKTVNCHMQAWVGANRGNVINFESGYKKQIRV